MDLEFTFFSPLTPTDWVVVLALIFVMIVYWLIKAVKEVAGGVLPPTEE